MEGIDEIDNADRLANEARCKLDEALDLAAQGSKVEYAIADAIAGVGWAVLALRAELAAQR